MFTIVSSFCVWFRNLETSIPSISCLPLHIRAVLSFISDGDYTLKKIFFGGAINIDPVHRGCWLDHGASDGLELQAI